MREASFPGTLPEHLSRKYPPGDRCIYCEASNDLTLEHIVPLGLGGNWLFPDSSCKNCAKITSAFEGTCLRTIFGPLRITYGMKTRRKKDRPAKLPLKVKFCGDDVNWQEFLIDREEYPYLIAMPKWQMPDDLTGYTQSERDSAGTKTIWIRGSPSRGDLNAQYEHLCRKYGFAAIMQVGTTITDKFCRLLAKIAHAFATAELREAFHPYLNSMILNGNMKGRGRWIGSLANDELPSYVSHEVSFH